MREKDIYNDFPYGDFGCEPEDPKVKDNIEKYNEEVIDETDEENVETNNENREASRTRSKGYDNQISIDDIQQPKVAQEVTPEVIAPVENKKTYKYTFSYIEKESDPLGFSPDTYCRIHGIDMADVDKDN